MSMAPQAGSSPTNPYLPNMSLTNPKTMPSPGQSWESSYQRMRRLSLSGCKATSAFGLPVVPLLVEETPSYSSEVLTQLSIGWRFCTVGVIIVCDLVHPLTNSGRSGGGITPAGKIEREIEAELEEAGVVVLDMKDLPVIFVDDR